MSLGQRRFRTIGLLIVGVVTAYDPTLALNPNKRLTQYAHRHWTHAQGLPQDSVRVITQAADGALWVGTDEGLARFDGHAFQSFRGDPDLPGDTVTALTGTRDGSVWIGTQSGVARYRGARFHRFDGSAPVAKGYVSDFIETKNGAVWAVGGEAVRVFRGDQVSTYAKAEGVPPGGLRELVETPDGRLIGAGLGTVVQFDGTRFLPVSVGEDMAGSVALDIATAPNGAVWVAGTRGLLRVDADGRARRYGVSDGLPDDIVRAVAVDRHGVVWVAALSGLMRLQGDRFMAASLPNLSPVVWNILEDRDGALWIGTGAGLHQLRDSVFSTLGTLEGLPSNQPSAVYEAADGALWVGFSDAGVLRRSRDGDRRYTRQGGLAADEVFAIRGGRNGDVLVGTRLGLTRVGRGGTTTTVPADPLGRHSVFDVAETPDGRIWLGTHDGLRVIEHGRQRHVLAGGPFLSSAVVALAVDTGGDIWAGTYGEGLWRFGRGEVRRFTVADGLASDAIRALRVTSDGVLWIGTSEGGLAWFRNGAFGRLTSNNGLGSNHIGQIIDDGDHLWLGTAVGLARVPKRELFADASPQDRRVLPLLLASDGLRSSHSAPGYPVAAGGTRTRDGHVWAVTANGLAVFTTVTPSPAAAAIGSASIASITIDGRHARPDDGLQLPAGTHRLEIHYSAAYLDQPERLQFRYRLDESDTTWVDAGSRRTAEYLNLPAGNYRFVVEPLLPGRGTGPAGEFRFAQAARWYEHAWVPFAALGLVATVAWSAYRARLGRLRRDFQIVLDERHRISRDLHDTLAQAFVGIGSQLGAVATHLRSDSDAAARSLDVARKMTQHSVTEAHRSVMDLRSSVLTGRTLFEAITVVSTEMTAGSGVTVDVQMTPALGPTGFSEEHDAQILRIVQEAIANAMKHAAPANIAVTLAMTADGLDLQIVDNGRGFDSAGAFNSAHGHFGLLGMRERARRLGGDVRVVSAPGQGTTVHVSVRR